jgi:signal transduction histidine kinase
VEARAVTRLEPRRRISRTLIASLLSAAAFAVLLVAWFASGWGEVRARQRELEAEPAGEAQRAEAQLARDLRLELSRVLGRESARDYYYYGNLYHDPRAINSWSVTPSPLASGPEDPLIKGHFQISPSGAVTTPTINDEVPELSEQAKLLDNQAFRDDVRRSFAAKLAGNGTLVADATSSNVKPAPQAVKDKQVVKIDPSSYMQNFSANKVFIEQQAVVSKVPKQAKSQKLEKPVETVSDQARVRDATPIPITISAFEWRTEQLAGNPSLVATRHVETPDGKLVQGFVVERAMLASWLGARAGDTPVQIHAPSPDEQAPGSEIAPGWSVTAAINPVALASASSAADAVARSFLVKFIVVGLISAIAFVLVVMLVARAERLARERSQFAAAAAHELRTPLAGLQLYGDMLSDGLGDPTKLSDYARRMSEEASRLGRVVSNVLGFSQLERGNLSIDARPGDLGAVLSELAERLQPTLDRAGAIIDLDVSPELRATFDRDAVTRIVGNLIDNAEKYSREAEDRTITLRAVAAKHEGLEVVEILVADHGPGVPASARSKLFKPFARGVSTDGPAGLGLGLALSQSLARAMGGELEYRDGKDGASFVLRLRA